MIITISGKIGAGKSTIAKALAKKLNLKHFSTGNLMRELAKEKQMTPAEFSRHIEENPDIDKDFDKKIIELGKTKDNLVMDSRLAFHFIPQSIKILLKIDLEIAAKRIFNQKRPEEKENSSLEKTRQTIQERNESEIKRYKNAYGLDYTDKSNFDLIINTSQTSVEQIIEIIIDFLKEKGKL